METKEFIFTQEARKSGVLKISKLCLNKKINCSPEARVLCGGKCCKKHNQILKPYYSEPEYLNLPLEARLKVEKDFSVKILENGDCSLISFCKKNQKLKPTCCKLFPLKFNKQGRLVLSRWVYSNCPGYKQGAPLYKTLKDCLLDNFGQEVYGKIVEEMENGKN